MYALEYGTPHVLLCGCAQYVFFSHFSFCGQLWFHSIFTELRYDAGINECTMAVNDDVYDASNEQLMANIMPVYSPSLELCASPQGEFEGNDILVVANSGEKMQKKKIANKKARGGTNEGAEEVEVVFIT